MSLKITAWRYLIQILSLVSTLFSSGYQYFEKEGNRTNRRWSELAAPAAWHRESSREECEEAAEAKGASFRGNFKTKLFGVSNSKC